MSSIVVRSYSLHYVQGVRMPAKLTAFVFACILATLQTAAGQEGLGKIKTIVVIYAENRSFDHLYGSFPGANGIANATAEQKTQLDHDGYPLPQAPQLRLCVAVGATVLNA